MALSIYQPPEDKEKLPPTTDLYLKPTLRIFSKEEREEPVIIQYVAQQRGAYQRPLYVSPWNPADTL